MKRLIFVIFLLACLSACKKEHVEPVSSPGVNFLPKKVVTHDSKDDAYTIQLYTYNTHGLVSKITTYDSLTPQDQDSTIYSYNYKKQLDVKRDYIDHTVTSKTYAYNNLGKLDTYIVPDTIYTYYYTNTGEVDYIIKTNYAKDYQDSIQMHPGSAEVYLDKGKGTFGTSSDYLYAKVEHFFNTENGIYEDKGIWMWGYIVWGYPSANTTVCIDKKIKFQDEVAYSIVPIGQAGYFNMYARTASYKYTTSGEYIVGPLLTSQHYEASYRFDVHGRLTFIDAQYLGRADIGVLSPSSIPYAGVFTKTIYY